VLRLTPLLPERYKIVFCHWVVFSGDLCTQPAWRCCWFPFCQYRGADKSLTRPGRKQARKHVRDERDFNNIDTRAVIRFFSFKARPRRKFTPFLQKHYLVSFLVGLRTYQHPCTTFCHRFRALFRSPWSPRSPVWAKTVDTRAKCVPNITHVRHADWMIFRHLSAV